MAICSCSADKGKKKGYLPSISGKAGEVIVVIDRPEWEGNLGNSIRELLASDYPYLPQKEPLYTLVNVAHGGFGDLFKVHRNIVFVNVSSQVTDPGVMLKKDIWAAPQCVIQINASSQEEAIELLDANRNMILNSLEQAERDRVIQNCIKYEEKGIAPKVAEVFGGALHFPSGYRIKKITSDFAWIAYEKQYSNQAILIYKYPVSEAGDEPMRTDNIIAKRNEILKDNVPGMFENTYMTTSTFWKPSTEYLKYKGREFAQTRGLWEVENDYMGGPFVSHSFYSKDGNDIIVCEAFVFAPRYDKRQYLRQVESILYSWEWVKNNAN